MMRSIFIFALLILYTNNSYSQVGINNEDPQATLDIETSKATTPNIPNGILIPRLTGDEIEEMTTKFTTANLPNSLLIYATTASTAAAPNIRWVGYWFFDKTDFIWKPMNITYRKSPITVYAGGGGDYLTLQDAYDTEAQKLYSPNSNFIEFQCKGNVGSLNADGVISNIVIRGVDNTSVVTSASLTNTSLSFAGDITISGDLNVINSYMAFYSPYLTSFTCNGQMNIKKTLFDVYTDFKTSNLVLDQSSLNVLKANINITVDPQYNPFGGGSALKGGLYMKFSSFKGLLDTSLIFNASNSFTYQNCVMCDDASFFSLQGTITSNATVSGSVILAEQSSKISLGNLNGSSVPPNILKATTSAEIEHFTGTITMNTSGAEAAMVAMTSGKISLGSNTTASSSVVNNTSVSPSSSALSATGGGQIIYYDANKKHTYNFNNFYYLVYCRTGGKAVLLGQIEGTTTNVSNLTPGTVDTTDGGSVFYQ